MVRIFLFLRMILLFIVAINLAACTLPFRSPTPLPSDKTTEQPVTATVRQTVIAALPSPTLNPPPATLELPSPITQLPPTSLEATLAQQAVKIILIAVGDNGKSGKMIGCGDSVISVQQPIPPTQGVLKAALEILLSVRDQYYGQSGLYNSLYQSDLQLESVTIENGQAIIQLTGTLKLGGVCDNPRVEAQITETALQFSTVKSVTVFLNGQPLKEALSLK